MKITAESNVLIRAYYSSWVMAFGALLLGQAVAVDWLCSRTRNANV